MINDFDLIFFIDKDTKQAVIYVPGLEISGYGETFEKADEILKCNLELLLHDRIKQGNFISCPVVVSSLKH